MGQGLMYARIIIVDNVQIIPGLVNSEICLELWVLFRILDKYWNLAGPSEIVDQSWNSGDTAARVSIYDQF